MGTLLIEFLNVYGCELDYAGKTICPELPDVFEPEATIIFDPHNFVYCS
jgi:non-canonical poly(A) RNA polymerase PAPD5/7